MQRDTLFEQVTPAPSTASTPINATSPSKLVARKNKEVCLASGRRQSKILRLYKMGLICRKNALQMLLSDRCNFSKCRFYHVPEMELIKLLFMIDQADTNKAPCVLDFIGQCPLSDAECEDAHACGLAPPGATLVHTHVCCWDAPHDCDCKHQFPLSKIRSYKYEDLERLVQALLRNSGASPVSRRGSTQSNHSSHSSHSSHSNQSDPDVFVHTPYTYPGFQAPPMWGR